jgi:predicted ester cyclase
MTDLERNKTLPVRYMEEVFNQKKFEALADIFAPPLADSIRMITTGFLSAFPDWHGKVESIVAEGDMVVNRWTGHGTHTAPLMGIPPTGKHVTLEGITIFRVKDGKVIEQWSQGDQLGLMKQLGVVP